MRTLTQFLVSTIAGLLLACQAPAAFCETDHKALGDRYLQQSQTALAIHEYRQAIALHPASTSVYFNLAIAYYSERDIKEATSALEKLVALDPGDVEAQYDLGCLKLYQRDLETARACFQRAKQCCNQQPEFTPLIDGGLKFVDHFKQLDPQTQDAVFLYLLHTLFR